MKIPSFLRIATAPILMLNLMLPPGGILLSSTAFAQDSSGPVQKLGWPRTFKDGSSTLEIYQPAIESWDGFNFKGRAAVSVQITGQSAPTFGVIWITAQTQVNKEAGIVTLTNILISSSNFPTDQTNAPKYVAFINQHVPKNPISIPLAQIDNKYLLGQALKKTAAQPVQNTPPQIIFSDEPALLVLINGDPVMRPLAGTDCNRVFNTQALIIQNAQNGGPFYLRALNYWYKADSINGPWTADFDASQEPSRLDRDLQAAQAIPQINLLAPPKGQKPPAADIYVSTVPTELVQTQGAPMFSPIPNTMLLEVKNSDNAIILNIGNQLYYVLISGRWFSSPALTGQPWTFVEGSALPADFAKIPPTSDKANVLVSVPGTPQAEEAVIANSIPQTATVNRQQAKLTVAYDGAPQFQPVTGTTLQYAINTPAPVIEVSPTSYYAVSDGVWFYATSPMGPWAVATTIPPVIYSIPVASPIHYVTYVQVYGYTDEVVYVGYTPGYYGTVVTPGGVVVYGSGYVYPPYVGTTVYVAPPATYGYGAGFADGAGTGFLFGFAAGALLGACMEPSWGCWGWGHGNTYNVNVYNGNVYNSWGNHVVTSSSYGYHSSAYGAAGYNPYNGNWAAGQHASGYNSATGTYAQGSRSASGNAYTGNYNAGRQGSAYNPYTGRSASGSTSVSGNAYNGNWNANQNRSYSDSQTGASASSSKTASGNVYNGTETSNTQRSATSANGSTVNSDKSTTDGTTTRSGTATSGTTGQSKSWDHTSGSGSSNLYAGSDGNVYKPSSGGGWQQQSSNGSWQNADHSSQTQDLNRQSQGWNSGSSRWGGGDGGGRWGGGGGGGGGGGRWGGGGGGRSWR